MEVFGRTVEPFAICVFCGTINDYTADVVRVEVGGGRLDLAKVGRRDGRT